MAPVWFFLRRQKAPHLILSVNYFDSLGVLRYANGKGSRAFVSMNVHKGGQIRKSAGKFRRLVCSAPQKLDQRIS